MSSEKALWDWMRRHWTGPRLDRIENLAGAGFPDVTGARDDGRMVLVELKQVDHWPKRAVTPVKTHRFTEEQKRCLREYGERECQSWVLIQVGAERFLVGWRYAAAIDLMNQESLRKVGIPVTPETLTDIILYGDSAKVMT